MQKLYTVRMVSEALHRHENTVHRWLNEGAFPHAAKVRGGSSFLNPTCAVSSRTAAVESLTLRRTDPRHPARGGHPRNLGPPDPLHLGTEGIDRRPIDPPNFRV